MENTVLAGFLTAMFFVLLFSLNLTKAVGVFCCYIPQYCQDQFKSTCVFSVFLSKFMAYLFS